MYNYHIHRTGQRLGYQADIVLAWPLCKNIRMWPPSLFLESNRRCPPWSHRDTGALPLVHPQKNYADTLLQLWKIIGHLIVPDKGRDPSSLPPLFYKIKASDKSVVSSHSRGILFILEGLVGVLSVSCIPLRGRPSSSCNLVHRIIPPNVVSTPHLLLRSRPLPDQHKSRLAQEVQKVLFCF